MRYAIISDVHANLHAFEAVLADISTQRIDKVICLGDAVGYGTQPVEVLDLVRSRVDVMLMGNHDAAVAGLTDTSEFSDGALLSLESTKPKLDKSAMLYLSELPYDYITPEMACAHADLVSPGDFNYVRTAKEVEACFEARGEQLLFVGHTHKPTVFLMGPDGACVRAPAEGFIVLHSCRYLVNPGSVGMPRTVDFRATYCIYDTTTKKVIFRRVTYDVDAFRKSIESDAKSSEQIAYVLELLDSRMLPVRKGEELPSERKQRKRERAADAAKAGGEKGRPVQPASRKGDTKTKFAAQATVRSTQPPVTKTKSPPRKSAEEKKSSPKVAVTVTVIAFCLVVGICALARKGCAPGSDAVSRAGVAAPPAVVISQKPAAVQAPVPQATETNVAPTKFEDLVLVHRWSFNNTLDDGAGGSKARIVDIGPNDARLGATEVTLTGGARDRSDYISLGTRLFTGRTKPVTIELWATQISVRKWGRIFDFGSRENNSFFMSWSVEKDLNKDRVEWQRASASVGVDNSNKPYSPGKEYHIVFVIEPAAEPGGTTRVSWYSAPSSSAMLGGVRGSFNTTSTLEGLVDTCDNLGRSFYAQDEIANASYNEVRIWEGAPSEKALEALHQRGPDAVFK